MAILSEEIAKIYWDKIWKLHRVLKRILSDRGPQFASKFMKYLIKALGMKRILSTAYHFQIDDQMEQINYKVEILL